MGRKKTHEEFVKEVYELVGDEYDVLENYKGSYAKVKFIHKSSCNHIFSMNPHNFFNGTKMS